MSQVHLNEKNKNALARRGFLNLSWRMLAMLAAGQSAYMGLRFLASRKAAGNLGEIVTVGLVAEFPVKTITPFEAERFFLVRFADGGFLALFARCTHLACTVSWHEPQQRFMCPCHGSEFQRDGTVLKPPAPRPLDRFMIIIEDDGRIQVDTRQPITRTVASVDDLVYSVEVHDDHPVN